MAEINKSEDLYVLTREVMEEKNPDQLSYTDVCGVTSSEDVAKAWSAGAGHRSVFVSYEDLNLDGYDTAEFA